MGKRSDSHDTTENLLRRLKSADAGPAWVEFLDCHAPLIMQSISQFEYGQDRRDECFAFICEKLYERQFRRLLTFNVAGKATFRNWLATVVFNLCVDWHRTEFGRATVLPAIAALPAFDQLVYNTCYRQGMSREESFQAIRAEFPELAMEQLETSLGRIHALLTPRQRWQLGVQYQRRSGTGSRQTAKRAPQPGPGPDELALASEEASRLQAAMAGLSTDQKLILHLRFQEGLTFQRIAQIEHLGDANRARRHVQAALDALHVRLRRAGAGQKR